jgi:hypothetical protein
MPTSSRKLLTEVHCKGEFEILRPHVENLFAEDLLFIGQEDFVNQLGSLDPDMKPVLRLLYITVTSELPGECQPSAADRVFKSSDGSVQVIDFSSMFVPCTAANGANPNNISCLASVIDELLKEGHIDLACKTTCLNLSKSDLGDDDMAFIVAGAKKLSGCSQLCILLKLTRLSTETNLDALLALHNLAWLDVSSTPFASIGVVETLASLKNCDVERLILVSNATILHNALPALFRGNESV